MAAPRVREPGLRRGHPVTLLDEKGVPTPVVHTRMVTPRSRLAPAPDVGRPSPLYEKYGTRVDAQSAREMLAARTAPSPLDHIPPPDFGDQPPRRRAPPPEPGGIGDFLNSRAGQTLQREVLPGMFGMLRRRRR